MKRFLCTLLVLTGGLTLRAQEPSSFIHIDQFGYRPAAEKVAVLANPQSGQNANLSFTPGAVLEVRRANNDALAWSGAPSAWNGGATHTISGDQGWWLDFTDLDAPGDYYIMDPTSGERSGNFTIGEDVYSSVMADAGKAFFYNRCGFVKEAPFAEAGWTDGMSFAHSLQDTECSYVNDRENASLRRDLSGGWFDAGDNNKYTTFAHEAVNDLLWAYRENPGVFTDSWNIPESGNGTPDILDEVKWEIDWLRKMVNNDGSAIIKMGNIDHGDNAQAPPSTNTDRRYYGPTCTSASISAASMLSNAAIVFQDFPAWSVYATEITAQAEAAFAFWVAARNAGTLETECDDGTIKAGDADVAEQEQMETALAAAVHLYELTGDETYNDYVRDNISDAEYFNSNWWGPYKNTFTTAMVHYLSLPGAHASTVTSLRNSMTGIVRDDWNGFFGFNEDDLYRAFMPDWSYHWGSNAMVARYGVLNRVMAKANLVANNEADLNRKADGMVHYLHGVNPMGFVYLSAMEGRGAERGIQEIYHFWFNEGTDWDNSETSLFGPAPGYLSGGPNKDFGRTNIAPPANEPPMKSYKDWNTGWPEDSWEITEPAIYYQASYIRNLAALIAEEFTLPVTYQSPFTGRAQAKTVLLEWRTASEVNASHFEVEYLNDRDQWEVIGSVNATGANRYQLVHQTPREGVNQYRLLQEDIDGTSSFSDIVNVIFTDRFADIKVFPNPVPVGTAINLSNLPAGVEVRLYDAVGRVLFHDFLRSSRISIATTNFPTGVYSLELLQAREGAVWRQKVILE